MVAEGPHAPQGVVESERQPGHGDPVPHENRGEHPPQLIQSEATVAAILDEVDLVVPVDELVPQRGREHGEREQAEPDGDPRRGKHRVAITLDFERRNANDGRSGDHQLKEARRKGLVLISLRAPLAS